MPMASRRFDAVVFDNDGLLLDTEPCWTRAQRKVFESHGRVFDLAAKQALVGTAPQTAAPLLEQLLDLPGQGDLLTTQMYDLAFAEISGGAVPRPGALELVSRLRISTVPIAVASNAPRRHLLAGLRRVGLVGSFPVVLGVDDVSHPKPAPDLYIQACAALGISARRAAALEDSPPGVAAARAAHLFVIGVPSIDGVVLPADVVAGSLADAVVYQTLGLT
jgi:HAD superfamily hydrolase (TIGR01509 family)